MKKTAEFNFANTVFSAMVLTADQFIALSNGLILDKPHHDDARLIQTDNGLTHLFITHENPIYANYGFYEDLVSSILKTTQVVSFTHVVGRDNTIHHSTFAFNKNNRVDNPTFSKLLLQDATNKEVLKAALDREVLGLSGTHYKNATIEYVCSTEFTLKFNDAIVINELCQLYEWNDADTLQLVHLGENRYCFASASADHGTLIDMDSDDEDMAENLELEDIINKYILPTNPDLVIKVTQVYFGKNQSIVGTTNYSATAGV